MRLLLVLAAVALFAPAGCSKDKDKGDTATDKAAPGGKTGGTAATPADDPNSKPAPASDRAKPSGTRPTLSTAGGAKANKPAADVKAGEPVSDGDDDCVNKCVQENQMRAVGPEVIESDCKKQCAAKK